MEASEHHLCAQYQVFDMSQKATWALIGHLDCCGCHTYNALDCLSLKASWACTLRSNGETVQFLLPMHVPPLGTGKTQQTEMQPQSFHEWVLLAYLHSSSLRARCQIKHTSRSQLFFSPEIMDDRRHYLHTLPLVISISKKRETGFVSVTQRTHPLTAWLWWLAGPCSMGW